MFVFIATRPCHAQYVNLQTVNVAAFNGSCVTTATPSPVFPNIGQSAHQLRWKTTGTVTALTIQLEGTFDNGSSNWVAIGPPSHNYSGLIEAGEYFPNVRARVVNITASGGGCVSAWYAATAGPVQSNFPGLVGGRINATTDVLAAISISGNGNAFTNEVATTNPVTNQFLWGIFSNASTTTTTTSFRRMVFFCSQAGTCTPSTCACVVGIFPITDSGTGCTVDTPTNLALGSSGTSKAVVVEGSCSVDPTKLLKPLAIYAVQANDSLEFTFEGILSLPNSATGIGAYSLSGNTGTYNITTQWYEQ